MRETSNRAITLFGPVIEREQRAPDVVLPAVLQSPPQSLCGREVILVASRIRVGGTATTLQTEGQLIPSPVTRPPCGPSSATVTGQPNAATSVYDGES